MTKILLVTSSPKGSSSYSTRVADHVVERLKVAHPGAAVTTRDLVENPPSHIDTDFVSAIFTPADKLTDAQRQTLVESDTLVDELLAADIVVIAAAMINFTIPSTLKTWIDNIARAGRTFRYENGKPQGLVTGKRVIVVQAKGGIYSGPAQAYDFVSSYLRHMLGFLGMSDIEVINVEGTNFGPEAADTAFASGLDRARELVPHAA